MRSIRPNEYAWAAVALVLSAYAVYTLIAAVLWPIIRFTIPGVPQL